ncbi:MAG TPA: C39 family peptidase [Anaerolineaceae bacterium]
MRKVRETILLVFIPLILLCAIAYLIPAVRSRVDWRVEQVRSQVRYALFPPEEAVFTPQDQVAAIVQATMQAYTPAPTLTPTITPTWTPGPTQPPTQTPTPTVSPTPLPGAARLTGVKYVDQHGKYNYCAPANLSMALNFWGWTGTRDELGATVKPFERDLNVMPYELVDYVNENTTYRAIWRAGGTLPLLKKMVAAGFPVLVERGAYMKDLTGKVSWMGHYQVVTGYDDAQGRLITQDSFYRADFPVSYEEMQTGWRAFNYVFLVVYPPEREAEVSALLAEYWDQEKATRIALETAEREMQTLSGADLYFAYFNRGTSLVNLQDYTGAAGTYDQAFRLYEGLAANQRPWRMLWYQTGPYFAYYYAGRYQDLIDLTSLTIKNANNPFLEETYYWRGLGYIMVGRQADAVADFRSALEYHPNFSPAVAQLQSLGQTP